ncbi:MAG: hypothetical protein IPI93_15220 [Sphingobacteriaceae bacterium]|nr:hypothetical protein [Sphingobacteriaceae bacterium]MBK7816789.1 hypothetical protein [Sphingobacteriaceae bacterium]
MTNTPEEIDLLYVLRNITKGTSNLFNWLFNTTVKHFILLTLFVLGGMGLGFSVFSVKQPVYTSEITISHIRFNNDQCYELINNLTELSGNHEKISKTLKLDMATAMKIKKFMFEPLSTRYSRIFSDSASVITPFKVEVEVYDPSIYDTLQAQIMNYLETNEYGVKRKLIDAEYWNNFSNRVEKEVESIDTLRALVNQSIKQKNFGSGVVIDQPIDPVKISQRSIELQNAQLKAQEKIKLNNSFELVLGFNGGIEKTADVILSMMFGAAAGYLIGLLWLYIRQKRAIA